MMRIFAPSFSDRVMYAYVLLSLLGSCSLYILIRTENHRYITFLKVNQVKLFPIIFIFIIFGLFSHTYGLGVHISLQERSAVEFLADRGEGHSITCSVDEREIFYYYTSQYPSEVSQVRDTEDPMDWKQAFSGQIKTDYIILPNALKQQYYSMRYGCEIPWDAIYYSTQN